MSHQNPDSQQPNPLETEAFLEDTSSQTIDVSATAAGSESDAIASDDITIENSNNTAIAPPSPDLDIENDGFLLARKLRQHNRELVKTVVQLEQALAESQERLQTQIARSRNADNLLDQQADNLTGNQSEIDRLTQDLQLAKADVREHRNMMNELNQTLKRSQTQLAQVERECTLLRESYDEQQQKLVAAEQEIHDLQARLQRQQRYAIQYKTALEKQGVKVEDITNPPITKTPIPKVSRIKPWSEQTLQPKPSFSSSTPTVNLDEMESVEMATEELPAEPIKAEPIQNERETSPNVEQSSLVLPPDVNEDLEQQLKALEAEMAVMSQEAATPPQTNNLPKDILQFPQFQDMPQQNISPNISPRISSPSPVSSTIQRPTQQMASASLPKPAQQKNWPSPTLNPLRTAKKRASLAAVELPSFSR
ncbi:hypothetical protein [[Limnothrix rosea] IAM M-220]|uniref:hypothetical protein n=1 Tax=[Limnothrix rosea] IAM M-220 TaxID=454133 RepID=UPI000969B2EE|nr:hypothetical protein [[Limnothrix rosea] IAM M-220]OKH19023.1 hypothetical protein NIES208_03375 [[Limnothrix rosea] IAM M-220]